MKAESGWIQETQSVMNEKVRVQICVGTACHIMGAADLITIEDLIAEPLRSRVEIHGTTCMGLCKDEGRGKPPFVVIDGETLAGATLDQVVKRVEERARRLVDGGNDVSS